MVTNVVKEEFKDIELHDGGGLNLMIIRDTQASRKRFLRDREDFFLTFGFKDVQWVTIRRKVTSRLPYLLD